MTKCSADILKKSNKDNFYEIAINRQNIWSRVTTRCLRNSKPSVKNLDNCSQMGPSHKIPTTNYPHGQLTRRDGAGPMLIKLRESTWRWLACPSHSQMKAKVCGVLQKLGCYIDVKDLLRVVHVFFNLSSIIRSPQWTKRHL